MLDIQTHHSYIRYAQSTCLGYGAYCTHRRMAFWTNRYVYLSQVLEGWVSVLGIDPTRVAKNVLLLYLVSCGLPQQIFSCLAFLVVESWEKYLVDKQVSTLESGTGGTGPHAWYCSSNSVSHVLLLHQVGYRLLTSNLQSFLHFSCGVIMAERPSGLTGTCAGASNWGNRSLCLLLIIPGCLSCSAIVSGQLQTIDVKSSVASHFFLWCNHGRSTFWPHGYVCWSLELKEQVIVLVLDHTRVTNLFCYCIRSDTGSCQWIYVP